jgi:malonate transporter and related proteins
VFILILAGYVSARRGLMQKPGIKGLNDFVFYFSLPLMLFHGMATAPLAEAFDVRFVLLYLACAVTVHLSGMAIARWGFRRSIGEQGIQGIAASFGNLMFIALPIAVALFGQAATLPVALLVTIESGIIMPFTVSLLEIDRGAKGNLRQAVLAAVQAVLRNPVVMSVLTGAAVGLLGVPLPSLFDGLVKVVSGATVPCALFALGASLAGLPISERLRETSTMVALKLFVYPLLVFGVMSLFPGIDPVWRAIAVLAAAMPMGANVYLIAARYETYVARASTAVLFSTILSVVTVSLLAVLLARNAIR